MTEPILLEEVIIAEPVDTHAEDAVPWLEQAFQANGKDPQVAYLLALAYKRLGKVAEARNTFRIIPHPDANVFLQLGVLSLREKQFAQAEQEFARAWQLDSAAYEAGYNLLLTRLALGQVEASRTLLPSLVERAAAPEERRFLELLQQLLVGSFPPGASTPSAEDELIPIVELPGLTVAEEQRLLALLGSIESFEVAYPLLQTLGAARPGSPAVQEVIFETALVQGKRLVERCEWGTAARLLTPLARGAGDNRSVARPTQVALLNLLGCCACLEQDFERGVKYFTALTRLAGGDPRAHQNLALAHEWQHEHDFADTSWNRFLDLLDRQVAVPPGHPHYLDQLAFEANNHLAELYTRKEKWSSALTYLQRAHRLRPHDGELLERLFHLYHQLKRTEEARRVLQRLRGLRPNDPQLDLYELDLRETKTLDDIDRMLNEIGRVLKRYPNDLRVEERAVGMVGSVIPLMMRLCDQFTEQMNKIILQVRNLPNYQINWSAVREVMHELEDEFLKLRRITRLCLPLVTSDEHRRIVKELSGHIDRKIEDCRRYSR
jgi:Flp pilus assembly protein TadD